MTAIDGDKEDRKCENCEKIRNECGEDETQAYGWQSRDVFLIRDRDETATDFLTIRVSRSSLTCLSNNNFEE